MRKANNNRTKAILIVLLCIFSIAAIISYFFKLQYLRWIAIILFFLAAIILAKYEYPEEKIPSIFIIVICTCIITFAPTLINIDNKSDDSSTNIIETQTPAPVDDEDHLFMTIYPAEKIDWSTGVIDKLWPIGGNYKVYDLKTGIIWYAHRVPGDQHVDVEPLTDRDTARLLKCFDITTVEEFFEKDLYERRPMLVTIGERTFACSLYAIPHSQPGGDTMTNNNFDGRICIHFANSKTHNGKVDHMHQEAIQYAWENAPNGHK